MGQGEPLLNWRNVFRTARTFCDDKGLNYGKVRANADILVFATLKYMIVLWFITCDRVKLLLAPLVSHQRYIMLAPRPVLGLPSLSILLLMRLDQESWQLTRATH